jgi:hypothetical protein
MPPDAAMLSAMTEAAFGLGMAYRDRHDAADDSETQLRCVDTFLKCFASVRLGIGLKLRLQREALAGSRRPASEREERAEALETERDDRPERLEYTERDRDRDTERASFPLLLKTLDGLVAQADAIRGPQPAELLTLKELLAQVGATPHRKVQPAPLKARLSGSVAGSVTILDRPGAPGRGPIQPLRRATGPPKR